MLLLIVLTLGALTDLGCNVYSRSARGVGTMLGAGVVGYRDATR